MVDPTDMETTAMKACLRPFGEAAAEIGFDKPLGDYSEAEAMQVINAIVTTYLEVMQKAEARANGLFDDLEELPWEGK